MFRIKDKIIINKKPKLWSSHFGRCPQKLSYPKEFTITKIENLGNHVAIGTKEDYGFDISHLIENNNIKLINESMFRINDKVKCIKCKGKGKGNLEISGSGWKEGLVFTITQINKFGKKENSNSDILFGGKNGYGVYENFVKLMDR